MNIRIPYPSKSFLLIFLFLSFLIGSCGSNKDNKKNETEIADDFNAELDDDLAEKINTAKKIFYSLPSPLETAMLIKSAGATYNETLLNPVSNTNKYNTNLEMALNLGIYSTDLSYASLFDQTQATLNYINAAKEMADGLEILDAINEQTIQRLEENINNRDIIIDIISETLLNSSSFLEDRGLQSTASLILVGGWVEGLYIATSLITETDNLASDKLVERIVDQKLTLDIVLNLLENNRESVEVQTVIKDVEALQSIYNKITIEQSEISAVEDPNSNITTLKSESRIIITPEIFNELSEKVGEIRKRYIS